MFFKICGFLCGYFKHSKCLEIRQKQSIMNISKWMSDFQKTICSTTLCFNSSLLYLSLWGITCSPSAFSFHFLLPEAYSHHKRTMFTVNCGEQCVLAAENFLMCDVNQPRLPEKLLFQWKSVQKPITLIYTRTAAVKGEFKTGIHLHITATALALPSRRSHKDAAQLLS